VANEGWHVSPHSIQWAIFESRFMTKVFIVFLLLLGIPAEALEQELQNILESEVQENMPGILFTVQSGDGAISWSGAAGVSEKESGEPLAIGQTFRIASVTKTFVAASILRLLERGSLQLDDLLSEHISAEHSKILSEDYPMDQITIRQALRHSAGFYDHTNAPEFLDAVLSNPKHEWTRTEQLRLGVEKGDSIGPPGEQFSYSDTGYILLGEIIEKYTHSDLDGGIKSLLRLEDLGLDRTDFERKDPVSDSLRIHQYFQGLDIYEFSPTLDYYGGGGLLSTTGELVGFFKALFQNRVFDKPETLGLMLEPVRYVREASMDYQMGIHRIQINGMTAYTHTGFWGTQVLYIPEIELFMAANYSSIWENAAVAPVFAKALEAL
jgi:D-alanyl-D-alanine carboxypeptidase